jgi:hypothetical protein
MSMPPPLLTPSQGGRYLHHLPPGNAPLTLSAFTGSTNVSSVVMLHLPFNAIHDADYTPVADTTPLPLDGQKQTT